MLFVPVFRVILPEAVPDATAMPFTVTVAVGSFIVGVTFIVGHLRLPMPGITGVFPSQRPGLRFRCAQS